VLFTFYIFDASSKNKHLCSNMQDKRTPLMVACAEGHVSVVQALLRCKASVNVADSVRL